MEWCDKCMDDLETPIDVSTAIKYIFDISEGLKYAHKKKIIHLDLKPQNILIHKGTPKISDWGMSKVISEKGGTTIGISLPYAAPEQFSKKFGKKDEQTDIWQLGVILFQLVTGKIPFNGFDFEEYRSKIISDNISIPSKHSKNIEIINHIIEKCLQKKKSKRYKKIDNLQDDLKEIR
jgi:serine/threonine protein kinase